MAILGFPWLYPAISMAISDLEKVVNRPQAENSEFHYVLKILLFATKGESCVLNVGVARWNF